ncbi:MAG: rhodanese-like domain-containing protein, partial [Marmoricola sp.]
MNGIPTVSVAQVPDPLPEALFVVDVREPAEWAHGRIDGSVHIPMSELIARIDEVPTDQQVLVVCKVGGRSAQVTQYLVQSGFEAVNLDGGVLEWVAAGRGLVGDH